MARPVALALRCQLIVVVRSRLGTYVHNQFTTDTKTNSILTYVVLRTFCIIYLLPCLLLIVPAYFNYCGNLLMMYLIILYCML